MGILMELTKFIDELLNVNQIKKENLIKIFHVFFIISFTLCSLTAYIFGGVVEMILFVLFF